MDKVQDYYSKKDYLSLLNFISILALGCFLWIYEISCSVLCCSDWLNWTIEIS